MANIEFVPLSTFEARLFQEGNLDANGHSPEKYISDGKGVPCRHCLSDVAAGDAYLLLAYRPFSAPQPFAEIGPIFLHASRCKAYKRSSNLPKIFTSDQYIMRGYNANQRIVYGTGRVVKTSAIQQEALKVFEDARVTHIHLRSAANNCYHCRIERSTL